MDSYGDFFTSQTSRIKTKTLYFIILSQQFNFFLFFPNNCHLNSVVVITGQERGIKVCDKTELHTKN